MDCTVHRLLSVNYLTEAKLSPFNQLIVNIIACLTLCILMDSSFWFDTINLGQSIVHI